jgi:acyl-CoA hydrolase
MQGCTPDENGYMSLAAGVDINFAALKVARHIIFEVNDQAPRILGDSAVHVSQAHQIVECSHPLPEYYAKEIGDTHSRIGRLIADMIPDGATLQIGVGAVPDAVLSNLRNHKNLGVHSEMCSDSIIDLIEAGVINNSKKTLHPRKTVTAFALGSKRLFQYVDNNPHFEFHPTSYVNDPFVIAQNDNMVALNAAIQVDLTGQVCSDSVGCKPYSGFGGQVDFIRGAARSKGGIPIISLPSTAKNDTCSRIVPILEDGSGVVTSRADVHYIITEYGVAYLHGKSLRQRAEALIGIAHPNFRDELTKAADAMGLLGSAARRSLRGTATVG